MFDVDARKLRKKAVLVGAPSRKDLHRLCEVLNSKEKKGSLELRRLIATWFKSGPNLKEMLYADKDLWRDVSQCWQSSYVPTKTGKAHIVLFPEGLPPDNISSGEDEARTLFAALTLNPEWHLVSGPCARCGSYYLKKTVRQKVYCSQRCGSAATALPAVQKKRAAEHARKLQFVERELRHWKRGTDPHRWKEWISKRTGVSVKWLSRAANKGELLAPSTPRGSK